MSLLSEERLDEIRNAPRPSGARLAVLELLTHIAAQQAEIDELKARIETLRSHLITQIVQSEK